MKQICRLTLPRSWLSPPLLPLPWQWQGKPWDPSEGLSVANPGWSGSWVAKIIWVLRVHGSSRGRNGGGDVT